MIGLSLGLGLNQQGGTSGANSLLQQLSGSSAVLAVYDWTDTTSVFRQNAYPFSGTPSFHAVASVSGMGGTTMAAWLAAQPSIVSTGTKTVSVGTHAEWLSDTSFRVCRETGFVGSVNWIAPSSGWYYVSGTSGVYDGSIGTITLYRMICDNGGGTNGVELRVGGDPGAFALLRYASAGSTIGFRAPNPNNGGRVDNLKIVKIPSAYSFWQPTSANQPVYNAGALFDGVNDFLFATAGSSYPNTAHFVYAYKGTDTQGAILGDGVRYFGYMDSVSTSSSTASLTVTSYVDGATIGSTRKNFYDAAANGAVHVVDFAVTGASALNLTATALGAYNTSGSLPISGRLLPIAILDMSHADYNTQLANARLEAQRQIGVLGL